MIYGREKYHILIKINTINEILAINAIINTYQGVVSLALKDCYDLQKDCHQKRYYLEIDACHKSSI